MASRLPTYLSGTPSSIKVMGTPPRTSASPLPLMKTFAQPSCGPLERDSPAPSPVCWGRACPERSRRAGMGVPLHTQVVMQRSPTGGRRHRTCHRALSSPTAKDNLRQSSASYTPLHHRKGACANALPLHPLSLDGDICITDASADGRDSPAPSPVCWGRACPERSRRAGMGILPSAQRLRKVILTGRGMR